MNGNSDEKWDIITGLEEKVAEVFESEWSNRKSMAAGSPHFWPFGFCFRRKLSFRTFTKVALVPIHFITAPQ
jgi:hypothetical protein